MKKKLPIILGSFLFAVVIWISVVLGNSFSYKIEAPLKVFTNDNEVAIKKELPATVLLNLNAQGWRLLSIILSKDVSFRCKIPAKENSIKFQLSNSIPDNEWLNAEVKVVDISPAFLQIELDKKSSKKVVVIPATKLDFKKGFGLARQLHTFPDSVTIFGAKSLLAKISSVNTKDMYLKKISSQFIEQVEIIAPSEVEASPAIVKVYGDVQKIVDEELSNIPIVIKNIPKNKTILLQPDKISLSVRGGINFLGKISADDFQVYIDYNDIVSDTLGSVNPVVVPPKYVRLIYMTPERIKYIIKKY